MTVQERISLALPTRLVAPAVFVLATSLVSPASAQADPGRGCPERQTCVSVPAGTYETEQFAVPLTFTLPAGWEIRLDSPNHVVLGRESDDPMTGAHNPNAIHVWKDARALSTICLRSASRFAPLDSEGLSEHWRTLHSAETSRLEEVFLGGLTGLKWDLTLRPSTVQTCPWSEGRVIMLYLATGEQETPAHVLYMGDRVRLYVLDHDGGNVIVEMAHAPDSGIPWTEWLYLAHRVVTTFAFDLE